MSDAHALYLRLLACNRDAFAEGYYDAAFHSLKAALHVAQRHQDALALHTISQYATQELAWIDEYAQQYEHSTLAASARNKNSVFLLLAQQADALAKMIEEREDDT